MAPDIRDLGKVERLSADEPARVDPSPVKILLVDDEPKNLMALDSVLAGDDRLLVHARSGQEALRHLLREDFAVILLDVHMPEMDGFQTAELIRARDRSRSTPIIFLTAVIRGELFIARGYSLGAVDYIVKPVDPDILRSKVAVFTELFRKTEQVKRQAEQLVEAEQQRTRLAEERAARAEAEVARDRLQQVIDTLPVGILITDADGRIAMSNPAAHDIMGRVPSTVDVAGAGALGRRHPDGSPCPPEDVPLARAVHRGEVVRGEQLLIDNASTGALVPVLINAAPLRDQGGVVVGAVSAFQDISHIKDLEQQKDAFLAAASHDLKSPLTIIKARAQILARQIDRLDRPEGAQLVEGLRVIDQATKRLTRMVNELLDIASLQMGRPLQLEPRSMDLVDLVREVAAELQLTTDRHQIRVECAAPAAVGEWDRERLERVLVNLITNAIKYSPHGGRIMVTLQEERAGDADWVVLRVSDRGIGIPTGDLPHIFDRFFRASNVEARIDGAGVGLAGVQQIIEHHGGGVSVESKEREGSVFTLRLPVAGSRTGR